MMSDRERVNRGVVSLALAALLIVVGWLARRIYPTDTSYVFWLFLFGASLFMADAAVTMTRMPAADRDKEDARDAAAQPWRIAFAIAFVLTLLAAWRTGNSYVTAASMLLAVIAAGVYLVRRRFFSNLRDIFRAQDTRSAFKDAVAKKDHDALAKMIEERVARETDPSRRATLLLSLGAVHVVRGAYDDAIGAFERIDRGARAAGDKPGESIEMAFVVDLNVASACVAKGDFAGAQEALDRIREGSLPPEFKVAYDINRSALLVGKGAHAEAIRFVDGLMLEQVPPASRFPFLRDLAEALAASGSDPERAMKVAEQCLEIESGPQALNVMAFVLIARKRFQEAAERLAKALELNPDGAVNLRVFAETLYYLGLAKRGTGADAEAREMFDKAMHVRGGGRFSLAARKELEARA